MLTLFFLHYNNFSVLIARANSVAQKAKKSLVLLIPHTVLLRVPVPSSLIQFPVIGPGKAGGDRALHLCGRLRRTSGSLQLGKILLMPFGE